VTACTFTEFEDSLSESCRTCQEAHIQRAAVPADDAAETALESAANAVCAPAVNCAETGNTAADCLATCAVAAATVVTAASNGGTVCAGAYTCVPGDGACPAAVPAKASGAAVIAPLAALVAVAAMQ
jgi:hypothetical protein